MSYFRGIQQFVVADPNNTSTLNLSGSGTLPGAEFTGSASSTLGVNGIQVSLKTDQNCTVFIDQSPDGVNWDISDPYNFYYSLANFGVTVQAISSFVRVRVLNLSTSPTTFFRLETALCPIVEALPRTLTPDGNVRVGVKEFSGYLGTDVEVSPRGELRTVHLTKLVGAPFIGTTVDPNFWNTSSFGTGTQVTQSFGSIQLHVSSSNGSASIQSQRFGRFVAGTSNVYLGDIRFLAQTGSCIQRWGAYSTSSGYFFEISSSVFGIGYRNNGNDTKVYSGNFNGEIGSIYSPTINQVARYEIYWTPIDTWWSVNEVLIHHTMGLTGSLSDTPTLPARAEIINTSGNMNANDLHTRVQTILRQGELESLTQFGHVTGSSGTQVLKYGAGTLHRVALNNLIALNGQSITLFDNIVGSGPVIAVITSPGNQAPTTLQYGLPFSTGLTVVVSGGTTDATIVYE